MTDPGEQKRGRSRKPGVKAPEPTSLFDISDQPPDTPLQVKSSTSIDAAKDTRPGTMTRRRHLVLLLLQSTPGGLARFQLAERLGIREHWVSSSIDALIKQQKIEEHPSLTIVNPASGRHCAILILIDSGDLEGAA